MDIKVTPKINSKQNYNQNSIPNFTAMLKGSAVRNAIKSAKDSFQLSEIGEILDNVSKMGDKDTLIDCSYDGLVKVSNSKMGKTVYQTKLKANEKSSNPYLEMLRAFNSRSNVNRYEYGLINRIFTHNKNKQNLYNLLNTYSFSPATKLLIEYESSKYPSIVKKSNTEVFFEKIDVEKMKEQMLKTLSSHF